MPRTRALGPLLDARARSALTRWLFDTGVWYRWLQGTAPARAAARLYEDQSNEIIASGITISELVSLLHQRGIGNKADKVLTALRARATVILPTEQTLEAAGRIHADERSHHRDFSLADALILAQAKEHRAHVLTTDVALRSNRQGVAVTNVPT